MKKKTVSRYVEVVNKSIEKERNIVFRNKAPGKMHKINYCRSIDMQCILIGRLQLVS